MSGTDPLLVQLARAIATTPATLALSERLCLACRDLAHADGASLTVATGAAERVTLFATDDTAARLEDLQEVLGQGPGHTATSSGELEVCVLAEGESTPWPRFARSALDLTGPATVHAVPIRPDDTVFGVLTLLQVGQLPGPLGLDRTTLIRLAAATGAAIVRDPDVTRDDLGVGPWASRSRIHQATGMVVVQLGLAPDDALAVLRAHAYAGDTTLAEVADHVLDRSLRFHPPREEG